jgi:hypothetical protein
MRKTYGYLYIKGDLHNARATKNIILFSLFSTYSHRVTLYTPLYLSYMS